MEKKPEEPAVNKPDTPAEKKPVEDLETDHEQPPAAKDERDPEKRATPIPPPDLSSQKKRWELELAIPWKPLGLRSPPARLDFKWADNCLQTGDWTDFTLNGDAAPNDRFNYRAQP